MNRQYKKEKNYLYSLINSIQYVSKAFTIFQNDGKYIFGITSAPGSNMPIAKILEYKTLYDTLCDLDVKVKFSLKIAIKYAYSRPVVKKFDMLKKPTKKEWLAYYYIENAIFRTSSMWDMLAQFYRVKYTIDVDYDKVHYKKIFDTSKTYCADFNEIAEIIHAYIKEEENLDCDHSWKGNHKFVDEYRNKMTHRNSPNVAIASDLDLNLKYHPSFILKRVIEDYAQVSQFLKDIIKDATEESKQIFENTFC